MSLEWKRCQRGYMLLEDKWARLSLSAAVIQTSHVGLLEQVLAFRITQGPPTMVRLFSVYPMVLDPRMSGRVCVDSTQTRVVSVSTVCRGRVELPRAASRVPN